MRRSGADSFIVRTLSTHVHHVRLEHHRHAIGIGASQPRISWRVDTDDSELATGGLRSRGRGRRRGHPVVGTDRLDGERARAVVRRPAREPQPVPGARPGVGHERPHAERVERPGCRRGRPALPDGLARGVGAAGSTIRTWRATELAPAPPVPARSAGRCGRASTSPPTECSRPASTAPVWETRSSLRGGRRTTDDCATRPTT